MRAIICATKDWKIGHKGKLLYHIPEDLARFKELTTRSDRVSWGASVVYGRKTLETFPNGKPLIGRFNYIFSRTLKQEDFDRSNVMIIPNEKAFIESNVWLGDIWCIGGSSVYEQLLPYCKEAYLTRIQEERLDATDEMPNLEDIGFRLGTTSAEWHSIDLNNCKQVCFRYEHWTNPAFYCLTDHSRTNSMSFNNG